LEIEGALLGAAIQDVVIADGLVDRVRFLPAEFEGGAAAALIELTARAPVKVFAIPRTGDKRDRLVIDVPRTPKHRPPEGRETVDPETGEEGSAAEPPSPVVAPRPEPSAGDEGTGSSPEAPPRVASGETARKAGERTWLVVIDPGHGGQDPGARGPGGLLEKDICLALGRSVAAELNRHKSVRAVLTRDSDIFLPLRQRTRVAAEKKADLFVSIHANANRNRRVSGTEVYFLSLRGASDAEAREVAMRENAADHVAGVPPESQSDIENILVDLMRTAVLERSSELASLVIARLGEDERLVIRGVKQAGFDVLKTAGMPSILVEAAFISHSKEAKLLKQRGFQKDFGKKVAAGILGYLSRAAAAEDTRTATGEPTAAPLPPPAGPAGS
jgi:N-acetylmuramoyl-L-alanine amidase